MQFILIYKGAKISNKGIQIGKGTFDYAPRVGEFFEVQEKDIYEISAVMYKTPLCGPTSVVIYLTDITGEMETALKNY